MPPSRSGRMGPSVAPDLSRPYALCQWVIEHCSQAALRHAAHYSPSIHTALFANLGQLSTMNLLSENRRTFWAHCPPISPNLRTFLLPVLVASFALSVFLTYRFPPSRQANQAVTAGSIIEGTIEALQAGWPYFALAFAAGWVFGAIRELVVIPDHRCCATDSPAPRGARGAQDRGCRRSRRARASPRRRDSGYARAPRPLVA